ncbi:DUF4158 domain-containing protein [Martelella sp. AMO21009]
MITIPDDDREIAKRYTLDRSDLIMRQNKPSNRPELVCVLVTLRYPGRPLAERDPAVERSPISGFAVRSRSSRDRPQRPLWMKVPKRTDLGTSSAWAVEKIAVN